MSTKSKFLCLTFTLLIGFIMAFGGCSAAKKPNAPGPNDQTQTPQAPRPTETMQMADDIAREASKVAGVNGASAVVAGKNVYIGLDIGATNEKVQTEVIEKNVLNRVKNMEQDKRFYVTSDADTVTRIRRVSEGIAAKKPVSTLNSEIQEIQRRITPKSK